MTDKHTPGPWTTGIVEEDDVSWFEVRGPSDDYGWATVVSGEVDIHADARLIAAAPDLLAALDDILNAYGPDEVSDAIHASRAVIAKARGQA